MADLLRRYGTLPSTKTTATDMVSGDGDDADAEAASIKSQPPRLIKSARRHIALLFGLLEKTQPTKELTKLLASVDNGRITSVQMLNETFGGYESNDEIVVEFPPPQAGEDYVSAEGRAVLKSTGKLLRIMWLILEMVTPRRQ